MRYYLTNNKFWHCIHFPTTKSLPNIANVLYKREFNLHDEPNDVIMLKYFLWMLVNVKYSAGNWIRHVWKTWFALFWVSKWVSVRETDRREVSLTAFWRTSFSEAARRLLIPLLIKQNPEVLFLKSSLISKELAVKHNQVLLQIYLALAQLYKSNKKCPSFLPMLFRFH